MGLMLVRGILWSLIKLGLDRVMRVVRSAHNLRKIERR